MRKTISTMTAEQSGEDEAADGERAGQQVGQGVPRVEPERGQAAATRRTQVVLAQHRRGLASDDAGQGADGAEAHRDHRQDQGVDAVGAGGRQHAELDGEEEHECGSEDVLGHGAAEPGR